MTSTTATSTTKCMCHEIYEPVCCNDRTYGNDCKRLCTSQCPASDTITGECTSEANLLVVLIVIVIIFVVLGGGFFRYRRRIRRVRRGPRGPRGPPRGGNQATVQIAVKITA
eukprot:242690_1